MKSEKILRGALLLSVLALPCLGGVAIAQDKPVALKLSHWVPPAHPLQPAMEQWAESVKQDSNGTITSTIFPSEQLGKAFDHYDMARHRRHRGRRHARRHACRAATSANRCCWRRAPPLRSSPC
jgi:hypothetical protein